MGLGLDTALQSAQLHTMLRAAGVTRVQVNVDDADVAEAMLRITTFDSPVSAVVSVWTEPGTDPEPISDLLAAISQRSAGWEVEETRCGWSRPSWKMAFAQRHWRRSASCASRPISIRPTGSRSGKGSTPASPSTPRTRSATSRTASCGRCTAPTGSTPSIEELFHMAAMTDVHAFYGGGGDDAELQRRMTLIESVMHFRRPHQSRFGADEQVLLRALAAVDEVADVAVDEFVCDEQQFVAVLEAVAGFGHDDPAAALHRHQQCVRRQGRCRRWSVRSTDYRAA